MGDFSAGALDLCALEFGAVFGVNRTAARAILIAARPLWWE
jgi:hypothetical protein